MRKLLFAEALMLLLTCFWPSDEAQILASGSSSSKINCGGNFFPQAGKNLMIGVGGETKKYKPNMNCLWTIFGDGICKPAITCNYVDLRPSTCDTEFVKISDGIGGSIDACEKENKFGEHKLYTASARGRDLYIEFHSDSSDKFPEPRNKGFQCEVSCDKPEISQPLPPDENGRKEGRCVCGIKQGNGDRIVNGEDADEYEFPWLAALVKAGTRKPICGGSVINSKYILTAAHCFGFAKAVKPADFEILLHAHLMSIQMLAGFNKTTEKGEKGFVKFSGWNLPLNTDQTEKSLRFKIEAIQIHSQFSKKYDYDVALLRVEGKIPLVTGEPQALIPICLPPPGHYEDKFVGVNSTVAGWGLGQHDAGATTRLLQKLVVPVLKTEDCIQWMPTKAKKITDRMLCAGYKEGAKDSCQGDSGGPLIMQKNKSQFMQIGIVSWGEKCALDKRPGFYSRLTELVQWVRFHSNMGQPTWCLDELL